MRNRWWMPGGLAAVALMVSVCAGTGTASAAGTAGSAGSSAGAVSSPSTGSPSTALKTRKINGVTVLTNAKGFTLYWFGPDTSTKSSCNGSCAAIWPPVKGPATAGPGVTGKLGTIKRSDGSIQATYNGHPLYTYVADTAPGQARGNGLNVNGGLWHEATASGAAAPKPSASTAGGNGY
jgi:predicted lipoprotein with Yx(FWY)xxD motif